MCDCEKRIDGILALLEKMSDCHVQHKAQIEELSVALNRAANMAVRAEHAVKELSDHTNLMSDMVNTSIRALSARVEALESKGGDRTIIGLCDGDR